MRSRPTQQLDFFIVPGDLHRMMGRATYERRGEQRPVPAWVWPAYLFWCRQANRKGESWWSMGRTAEELGWSVDRVKAARKILLKAAYDGRGLVRSFRKKGIRTWVTKVIDRVRSNHLDGVDCPTCGGHQLIRGRRGSVYCRNCSSVWRGPQAEHLARLAVPETEYGHGTNGSERARDAQRQARLTAGGDPVSCTAEGEVGGAAVPTVDGDQGPPPAAAAFRGRELAPGEHAARAHGHVREGTCEADGGCTAAGDPPRSAGPLASASPPRRSTVPQDFESRGSKGGAEPAPPASASPPVPPGSGHERTGSLDFPAVCDWADRRWDFTVAHESPEQGTWETIVLHPPDYPNAPHFRSIRALRLHVDLESDPQLADAVRRAVEHLGYPARRARIVIDGLP